MNGSPVDNPSLSLVEACCISYFTIEFLLRFAGSPGQPPLPPAQSDLSCLEKLQFLKGTMNIVDCLAIAPYYLTLFFVEPPQIGPVDESLVRNSPQEEESGGLGGVGRIMQVQTLQNSTVQKYRAVQYSTA